MPTRFWGDDAQWVPYGRFPEGPSPAERGELRSLRDPNSE